MATINVTDAQSLNNAIQAANVGDIVQVMNDINLDGDGSGFSGSVTVPATSDITVTSNNATIISSVLNQRHFIVNGTLTTSNITLDGGSGYMNNYPATVSSGAGGMRVLGGGKLYINTGTTIQNCYVPGPHLGQAVLIESEGYAELDGGIIQYNTSLIRSGGGAVTATGPGATFVLNSGIIQYNTDLEGSGTAGVFIRSGAVGKMTGGTISHNIGCVGAGVNLDSSTFSMTNGTISNNHASCVGGGLRAGLPPTTVTITGGTITSNISDGPGGGIYLDPGTGSQNQATISNVLISGNTATQGGGYFVGS